MPNDSSHPVEPIKSLANCLPVNSVNLPIDACEKFSFPVIFFISFIDSLHLVIKFAFVSHLLFVIANLFCFLVMCKNLRNGDRLTLRLLLLIISKKNE